VPPVSREVRPCQKPGYILNEHAVLEAVPAGWALLPPGDAALSRRIKADGPSWTMSEKKGNKRFSRGIWAPAHRIAALRAELLTERADPAYERKLTAARERRAKDLYGVLQAAEAAYAKRLRTPEGAEGLAYLKRRGLTE
jgi:hypothetical protein